MDQDRFRAAFMAKVGDFAPFQQLLDLLPDIAFFVKDRQGRFIMQNRRAYEVCHVATERETIGRTDHDFFPKAHADLYVAGDQRIFATGEPLINMIEPLPDSPSSSDFIVCSKYPIRDRRRRVIGVACMYRRIDSLRVPPTHFGRIAKALDAIHHRYAEALDGLALARLTGISRRQFERHFRRVFGATPHDYLMRVRVNAACTLLADSDKGITDVALAVGFYDHSHFSRTFRRIMGIAPLAFRRRKRV